MPADQQELSTAEAEWAEWHRKREETLASQHGWLTLTSFQWLPSVPEQLEGLPGLWRSDGTTAALTTDGAEHFSIANPSAESAQVTGQHVSGTITAQLSNGESLMWLRNGELMIELAMRSNRYAVRIRDPRAATLREFDGVPTFDFSPGWVVPARFTPHDEPRTEPVKSARHDVTIPVTAVGDVLFEFDGGTHRLAASAGADGGLRLNFHDQTNGVTTAAWRFVETGPPAEDGSVTIDFNRAINYPFSFTDFGACPAPMRVNSLELAVEAGEKAPH
ncbi:DUF1684 domain-containing protein [Arthrobacter monumenti]